MCKHVTCMRIYMCIYMHIYIYLFVYICPYIPSYSNFFYPPHVCKLGLHYLASKYQEEDALDSENLNKNALFEKNLMFQNIKVSLSVYIYAHID
jgi:hypothetical protein